MSELSYVELPKPVEGDELLQQARSLREIRLLSLQTDPSSWISRYEDEADQPLEFTINRVQPAEAIHFVAIDQSSKVSTSTAVQYEAVLVLIVLDSDNEAGESIKEYSMAAVYVRQHHRGKGVCTRLIQEAIRWVNEDFHKANVKEASIHTIASEENIKARMLYQKLGFSLVSHTTEKDKAGADRKVVKMKLHLY